MITLKDIALSPGTKFLLMENGVADRMAGVEVHQGWRTLATACGYSLDQRTPAEEAYKDGYYAQVVSEKS
jgi:hypothetical protein